MQLSIIFSAAFILEQYTKEQMLAAERSELLNIAVATETTLPSFKPSADIDEQIYRSDTAIQGLSDALDARTTLVNDEGKVIADSEVETSLIHTIDNHADRPEIKEALKTGTGYSVRYSDTEQHDVMYVAIRLDAAPSEMKNPTQPGASIIRISRAQGLIARAISDFQLELLKIGFAITLLSIVISVVGVTYLSRKIKKDSDSLEARVENRTEEIVMLQMLSSLLNTCESLDEASTVMAELVPKLLPGCSGGISIFKASRNRLDLLSHWGEDFNSRSSLNPHDCWALKKGHQHYATARGVVLPCEHWLNTANNTLCIPLLAQGETVGVLHLDYHHCDIESDSSHIRESIAEQTGLTLANIQLRQQLREQAQRDPMTGLYNRIFLSDSMDNFMHAEDNREKTCAVLMIDADNFKRFNDNFGHDAGDLVLKAIAGEIQRNCGDKGLPCRYGGEEFCVFLPEVDKEAALVRAEVMRQSIASLNLSINNLPLGNITVSIGIALAPEHTKEQKTLISQADKALYQAKEAGRDQIVVFEAPSSAAIDYLKTAS